MIVRHAMFLAQVSEAAAEKLLAEYAEKVRSLSHMPARNPWFDEAYFPVGKYRKLLLSKRYLIIYQIKGDEVLVDYVVDCRQQDYGFLIDK